ncbi:MAG TPA: amino acid permease, partial [Actinomycetota bacterium]|nr:amino acid permease [Actinomycetota bacterium]
AATTLAVMGAMSISMFLGITLLARLLQVRVNHEIALHKSVLAQIGETLYGRGLMFFLLQTFTAGILVLAANTSYQDFPRLSSILARDKFMPSQFRNRGDRLVFSNGVVVLALLASVLIWVFHANLTKLIQLYVVGVFTAFTLSQAGMVRRWRRLRGEGWRRSMIINAIGAVTTGVVLIIVAATKFRGGAWIVLAAMPVIVVFFLAVHRHYESVGRSLRAQPAMNMRELRNTFILLVSDLELATTDAVAYLRAVRPERVTPLYVGHPSRFDRVAREWPRLAPRLGELQPLGHKGNGYIKAVRRYLHGLPRSDDEFITVVIPEAVTGHSLVGYARRGSAFWLKAALLFEPGIVVTDVPLLPEERSLAAVHQDRPLEPARNVVLIPVSAVHAGTARAVQYAKSLHPTDVEALFFSSDPEEIGPVLEDWARWNMDVSLSVIDSPFRDIKPPLLEEIRRNSGRGDTIVTVVIPEFIVRRWWEHLLHNQTGLYMKRFLLFEPGVVVTSVAHQL